MAIYVGNRDGLAPDILRKATPPTSNAAAKEPTFSEMTPLNKTLDVIGRPAYALKSAITEIQKQSPKLEFGVDEYGKPVIGRYKQGEEPFSASEIGIAAWKGFKGEEKITANDIWKRAGVSGVPLLGFLTECALDPLQYGGYSLATKGVTKGVKVLGKGAMAVEKGMVSEFGEFPLIGKGIKSTDELITNVKNGIDKAVEIAKKKIPLLDISRTQTDMIKKRATSEIEFGTKLGKTLKSISKETGMSIDDVWKETRNAAENITDFTKPMPEGMNKNIFLTVKILNHHYTSELIEEMKSIKGISALGSAKGTMIQELRDKLNLMRSARFNKLTDTRNELSSSLDDLINEKLTRAEANLVEKKDALTVGALSKHRLELKSLIDKTNHIDEKLKIYEQQIDKFKLHGIATKQIENNMQRLSNEYWYYTGKLADRLQDIPELTQKGNKYLSAINEIEGILKNEEFGVELGRSGLAKVNAMYKIDEELATGLPPVSKRAGQYLMKLADIRAKKELGYFPRIAKKEMLQYLDKAKRGGMGAREWNNKLLNAKRRITEDMTFDEANKFLFANGLKGIEGKPLTEFFMTDPAKATAIRGIRSVKAVESSKFFDEIGRKFGEIDTLEDALPSDWVNLPESITKLQPQLRHLKFDPDIANEVNKLNELYFNPKSMGKFMQGFDTAQGVWKKWRLAIFPQYHLRNAVGNAWNNFLADVDPNHYPKAQAVQMYRKYGKTQGSMKDTAIANLKLHGLTPVQADDIIHNASEHGVFGRGLFGGEVEKTIERQVAGKKSLVEHGMAFGETIENNARLAHYMDKVSKGMNPLEASNSVKKFLFDYQELSNFEKQIMRRIFPFYTWTRKNVPLQLEQLWKNPEKFTAFSSVLRNRDPKDLIRLKYARPDIYDALPMEFKTDIDKRTFIPLEGLIPAADISKIANPKQWLDFAFEMFDPFVKTAVELKLNQSGYYQSEIERYQRQTQPLIGKSFFLNVPAPVRYAMVAVLPQGRILTVLDRIVKKKDNKVALNPYEQTFVSTLGSIYKTDIKELRNKALVNLRYKAQDLRSGARYSKKNGNEYEYNRIKDTYKKLMDILNVIK